jgi:hypothetical protein
LTGDEAVFKVLRWTGGNFELNFEGKTDQETTKLNTQGLLMEGLRLLDESQRDGGAEPAQDNANAGVSTSATAGSATDTDASAGAPNRRSTEEEEDVLLDN